MTLIEPLTIARYMGPVASDPAPLILPLAASRAAMGFPSPAEDFQDDGIDLNEILIRNPAASYLYKAVGWSMLHAGICDGDILVIDRSVTPLDGDIVLATWDGNQPVCKVLHIVGDRIELHSRNPHCPNITLERGTEVEIFAIVSVVRQMRRGHSRVRAG